jgi:hypothetical protein
MRRLLLLSLCLFSCSIGYSFLPTMSTFGDGFDIQLQDAVYGDGTIKTEKGGIIKAKDLFLQAQVIEYSRTGEGTSFVHKVTAKNNLFVTYKGHSYRGERAEIDLTTGKLTVWDGCTQSGAYFIGGKVIEISSDGNTIINNAYVSTSENERSDWTISATTASVSKNNHIQAKDATFYFVHLPLFWVPSFSTDLLHTDGGPFRYRVRWGGSEKMRLGISYLFTTGRCKQRALVDYSMKNGFGTGLLSSYKGLDGDAAFDALNYIAQGENKSWDSMRYRFQGYGQQYFSEPNLRFTAMYDKLSDKKMKTDYADHAISDARAGLTEATLWHEEADWKANLNTRVKINDFQTVKQELPLLSFNKRPIPLGRSSLILDNRFSAGYLNYQYAYHTPSVRNFASSRIELAQRLYTTYIASPIAITPSIGYRLIQYSNSPQHGARLQAIGEIGVGAKTRFVSSSSVGQQVLEPYVQETSLTHPPVQPNKTFIFDIEDGWTQMNTLRYGMRHSWYLPASDTFTPKVLSDLYTRSFFASGHLSKDPYKIWLVSTWDATPKVSYKLDTAWDVHHHFIDHCNVAMRQTLTRTLAVVLEWRQRSAYAWRKLDAENFIVDAVRSPKCLHHSEMSDRRKTFLCSFCWSPTPAVDIDFTSYYGFRHVSPRRYANYEINLTTLIRGALRVTMTYYRRPGGPTNGFYITCALGPKKESSSTSFHKIGDGNYDLW